MSTDDKPTPLLGPRIIGQTKGSGMTFAPRFPLGPSDTFNGVPWKDFCEACRIALDTSLRSGAASANVCGDCAAMLVERGRIVATDDSRLPVGVSSDGSIVLAPSEPPATEHPAPWRIDDEDAQIVDADGATVLMPGNYSNLIFDTPGIRELVRAAPEMASLLHELAGPDRCSCSPPCAYERARDLLARLDKAKGE